MCCVSESFSFLSSWTTSFVAFVASFVAVVAVVANVAVVAVVAVVACPSPSLPSSFAAVCRSPRSLSMAAITSFRPTPRLAPNTISVLASRMCPTASVAISSVSSTSRSSHLPRVCTVSTPHLEAARKLLGRCSEGAWKPPQPSVKYISSTWPCQLGAAEPGSYVIGGWMGTMPVICLHGGGLPCL